QMVGKAKLVQIQPHYVVLSHGGKTQKLLMFPGLEKEMNAASSPNLPKKTKK
ncbi:MAG: hypothetical protein HYZ45_08995, partial [Burkholderiales bacterium]|nr:hypothetical protein [Burkholderiales bacterium]